MYLPRNCIKFYNVPTPKLYKIVDQLDTVSTLPIAVTPLSLSGQKINLHQNYIRKNVPTPK